MKNKISEIFENVKYFSVTHWPFLIGLMLTLMLLWPLFASPYFTHHDSVQVIRLYEMDKCIKDGQIPCRWVPDLGGLYGYPMFNYYAPLAYYYGEIFYTLSGSFIFAAKIMFTTGFLMSFVFMYLLGRKLWGEKGGALSAIFFIFAPYHAMLFYVRGAMGELWGVMFIPAIFWSVLRLKEKTNLSNFLLLSLFFAGLVLSHNLSTFIFMPFLLTFTLIVGWQNGLKQFFKLKFFWYFALSILTGVCLSAFYWLPAALEKSLAHIDSTISGYFYFTEHFKGLRKLLMNRSWGYGASVFESGGRKDGLSFQIGTIHLFGWALAIFTAFKVWQKDHKKSIYIIFLTFAIAVCIFMIHPRSRIIWEHIDPIKYVQFPWRFLGLAIFFISLIIGSIFYIIPRKFINLVWFSLVVLVFLFNFSYFRPEKFINIADKDYFVGKEWDSQIKRSIFDFLPIYASEPPAELATSRYEIITGEAKVTNYQQGTNWFKFNIDVKRHTIIRISQYYFPNWIIKVNGKPIYVDYGNHLGLMTIILGKGTYQVDGRLHDTLVRAISNRISFLSILIVIFLGLFQVPKIRKWLLYYLKRIN